MQHRDFVKVGVIASKGLFFVESLFWALKPLDGNQHIDDDFCGFQQPSFESKLFVRWWWNGNKLYKKEILRELDDLKSVGVGGIEINPIAKRWTRDQKYFSMGIIGSVKII